MPSLGLVVRAAGTLGVLLAMAAGCSRDSGSAGEADPGFLPDFSKIFASLNSATGHVESSGSTGAWKFERGSCYAGDNDGYFGIQVQSRANSHEFVKLVKDPTQGWTVLASIPSTCSGTKCTLQYFRPDECKPLEVDLKAYTFRQKGTHQFDGDVTFHCSHEKAHVSGKLHVSRCVN